MFKKLGHYAHGAVKFVEAQLYPESTMQQLRLTICASCSDRQDAQCSICGCYLAAKTKLPNEHCPKGKW